jgi:hypothetical protein
MSVRGARGNVRTDTTTKSASAKTAEAMSGVDVREKPRMNFATANSGARAADGRIEGRRRALRSGKESGSEKGATLPLLQSRPESSRGPKGSTANPHLLSGSPRGLLFISLSCFMENKQ